MSKLKIGDTLPEFELPNEAGEMIHSSSLLGQPFVLFFYPKDDTPGCTIEACGFRDSYEDFLAAGAKVIGVSADDAAAHQKFIQKYRLPYTLLSDKNNALRQLFGVPKSFFGLLPGRVTYIFNAKGVLIYTFESQIQPGRHIKEALAALKPL